MYNILVFFKIHFPVMIFYKNKNTQNIQEYIAIYCKKTKLRNFHFINCR